MKKMAPKTSSQKQKSEQLQLIQMLRNNPLLMKKCQEELNKYQGKQNLTNVIHPPMSRKQYIEKLKNKQIYNYLDDEGTLRIQPEQAFVLQYSQKKTKQKVFVNIVKHQVVDNPQQKQSSDDDYQVELRIPMSMGRIREDKDKNGNTYKIVDVVMNPKIILIAEKDESIFNFMNQIISNYLFQKYKIAVSHQNMRKVEGITYQGTYVEHQKVRVKKGPSIQQFFQEQIKNDKVKIFEKQKFLSKMGGYNNQDNNFFRPQFKAIQGIQQSEAFESEIEIKDNVVNFNELATKSEYKSK